MLYDYPQYYEIAFSFRDIEAEASFLDSCIKRFSKMTTRDVFEIACGPAPHAGALTQLGYAQAYNIAGGFEGDHDENGHRGFVNGWKAEGLPWRQG